LVLLGVWEASFRCQAGAVGRHPGGPAGSVPGARHARRCKPANRRLPTLISLVFFRKKLMNRDSNSQAHHIPRCSRDAIACKSDGFLFFLVAIFKVKGEGMVLSRPLREWDPAGAWPCSSALVSNRTTHAAQRERGRGLSMRTRRLLRATWKQGKSHRVRPGTFRVTVSSQK
jgi:hypothetical protein